MKSPAWLVVTVLGSKLLKKHWEKKMFSEITKHIPVRRRYILAKMKRLPGVFMIVIAMQLQGQAQEFVLQDTTITTKVTIFAKSIIAGPNLTIANTGDVIFNAETIAVIPQFFVVQGGKLHVVSKGPPVSVETEDPNTPDDFIVHQNFPNPFNPETVIRFVLTKDSPVVITIYNSLGQKINILADAQHAAGFHSVRWDGRNRNGSPVSSGVYLYHIQAGEFSRVRKMSLIK